MSMSSFSRDARQVGSKYILCALLLCVAVGCGRYSSIPLTSALPSERTLGLLTGGRYAAPAAGADLVSQPEVAEAQTGDLLPTIVVVARRPRAGEPPLMPRAVPRNDDCW